MIHSVKCIAKYFEDVISGRKCFESRRNDRDYKVGDFIALNEVQLDEDGIQCPTGKCTLCLITYVLDDPEYVKEGYVILGLRPCGINPAKEPQLYQGLVR